MLATATCVKKDQEESKSQGLSAQKKLKADWKLNLGERIVALALGRVMNSTKKNDKDIIALSKTCSYRLPNTNNGMLSGAFHVFH